MKINKEKFILDACCSARSFWYNKHHPNVLYIDNRITEKNHVGGGYNPNHEVKPDMVVDFRDMPFKDNTFNLVVFDPPHLLDQNETSMMARKFGSLKKGTWKEDISKGFKECYRVLKDKGIIIFKWNEVHIPFKEVLSVIPIDPLFGHNTARHGRTMWYCFIKIPNLHNRE